MENDVGGIGVYKEDNPALGYRAIRICLTRLEISCIQFRVLFRASVYVNLEIMYPMIISVNEVKRIKEISKLVKEDLIAESIIVGELGADITLIETFLKMGLDEFLVSSEMILSIRKAVRETD